jgi:Helix-turn-helix domain
MSKLTPPPDDPVRQLLEQTIQGQKSLAERLDVLNQRLDRMDVALDLLVQQRTAKEFYTTTEVAKLLGRAAFTVREWCRLGRVNACKRACGRGQSQDWVISHAELERIRNEGLLPQPTVSTRLK